MFLLQFFHKAILKPYITLYFLLAEYTSEVCAAEGDILRLTQRKYIT